MPTSQYVYTASNESSGPVVATSLFRRRSERILRRSLSKESQSMDHRLHDADGETDPDETLLDLDDGNDETVLLSFLEAADNPDYGGAKPHYSLVDSMDIDKEQQRLARQCDVPGQNHNGKVQERDGVFLSDDPLTSSTTKATPATKSFSNSNTLMNTTERLQKLANQLGAEESDSESSNDMTEHEFSYDLRRRRAQYETLLDDNTHALKTQQSGDIGQKGSNDTVKVSNHIESSALNRRGQPIEEEIHSLKLTNVHHGHENMNSQHDKHYLKVQNDKSRINSLSNSQCWQQSNVKSNTHDNTSSNCRNDQQIKRQTEHKPTNAVTNPYLRKQPLPPCQISERTLQQTSLEHNNIKPQQEISSVNVQECWQKEAFRSSLLDLLAFFPIHYFTTQENTTSVANDQMHLFEHESIVDNSPHSTTSQHAASMQLNRQRLFDAASRSLARLAIASRHQKNHNSGSTINDHGKSPDFDPPSPRSLPAFMSVMNVYDESIHDKTADMRLESSNGVFSGQSVHGHSARTLHLASDPSGSSPSPTLYSTWTLEKLAFGSLILAARVCIDSSCDDKQRSNEREMRNTEALVVSSLGFLATAFACLDSNIVLSVLKVPLMTSDGTRSATVFDLLCDLAPSSLETNCTEDPPSISTLSFLALSRGLEAVIDVARHTSIDPSSTCAAYLSPHNVCQSKVNMDTEVNRDGVGWLSALGRDLGLKLEDTRNARPRCSRLSDIARCSYDFILSYDPMEVRNESSSSQKYDGRKDQGRGTSRGDLYIDVQGALCHQGSHIFACRQQAVMKDRVFSANVTFLVSMIYAGIVPGWLSNFQNITDDFDPAGSNRFTRVNDLCRKLLNVIETTSRLRRSVNQTLLLPDSGDSEAVCASSLSLLFLLLPEQNGQSSQHLPLCSSLRQMGNSTGSLEDLLHSPLVRSTVELALTRQHPSFSSADGNHTVISQAVINATLVLSQFCMVGGATLLCNHFRNRLDECLRNFTREICERGKLLSPMQSYDYGSVHSCLSLFFHLHLKAPVFVRQFLRDFFKICSVDGNDHANNFVIGLLRFSTDESFTVSSCASSLLRALLDGNSKDQSHDVSSLIPLHLLDAGVVGAFVQRALPLLSHGNSTAATGDIPFYVTRYHPLRCYLGDLICICIRTIHSDQIIISTLSDDVLHQITTTIQCDSHFVSQSKDTLIGASILSLFDVLFAFVDASEECSGGSDSTVGLQNKVIKVLRTVTTLVMSQLEVSMLQGTSVDLTRRALKLQSALLSIYDERFIALCFTNSNSAFSIRERNLRDHLSKSLSELSDVVTLNHTIQQKYDNLNNAYHDQRILYERRIEWMRSESRTEAKHHADVLDDERKRAEEKCEQERTARVKVEHELELLAEDSTNNKLRVKAIEDRLARECKSKNDLETELSLCKKELSRKSIELQRISSEHHDLEAKLLLKEDAISGLLDVKNEMEADLEKSYSKLLKLATIHRRNERDFDKCKSKLRIADNRANEAFAKYEVTKKQNKLISEQLKQVMAELNSIKSHRVDVQRMRKNAPVSYINKLHDESMQQKLNYSGKENLSDKR